MATTYTWGFVQNAVARQVARLVEDDFASLAANMALNEVWTAWDWREAIVELPPFYLQPDEQDHGAPAVVVPSDFMGLRVAYLTQLQNQPIPRVKELRVVRDLAVTHFRFLPHAIAYEQSKRAFRLFPRTPESLVATDYMVSGEYKKRPAKIVSNAIAGTALPFDDIYIAVMIQAMKWAALSLMGDPRAGGVAWQNGQKAFTGELAALHEKIDWMAANEGLELADPVIAPSEPLTVSGMSNWYSAAQML